MFYQISKWGRAKKTQVNGKSYDSKFEASYARDLRLRLKAGEIKAWESHVRIPLIVKQFHVSDYYVDFLIYHNDNTIEYVETKGLKTAVFALKWKILEAMTHDDPTVRLTLVMQKQFRLRRIKPWPKSTDT